MTDGLDVDVEEILERAGFDESENVLTRRQAEVLALREQDISQADIAAFLGTSRANVSSVEASARENVAKARETVDFAETLKAPVQLTVAGGTDLYDVPDRVYTACDEAGVKVTKTAPELMKLVGEAAGDAIVGREVKRDITVTVTNEGTVRVRG
ncbi:MAG: Tfx family DNA-binding protein [Natronomonas sp.]